MKITNVQLPVCSLLTPSRVYSVLYISCPGSYQ